MSSIDKNSKRISDLIETVGLSKRYGKLEALCKISFKIGKGITGLIGPNGAGKSTLIKIILGLVSASAGEATVFGFNCWKDKGRILERVGVLHEKPRFPPWVTGREYLGFSAKLKRISEIAKEIERISEICGLDDFVDRKIGAFSAGMVQRLGLADALIGKPELVILDEPTANLDPLGRLDVLIKIKRLRDEQGISFLVSTHILSELERVCDNIIILNEGLVLTYGPFLELISKYASPKYMSKVDDPEKFMESISKKAVTSVSMKDDSIVAEVGNYHQFTKEVNDLVKREVIALEELKPVSTTLEDIFVEVMRRKS